MDAELAQIIGTIDRPKRKKDVPVAVAELRANWEPHYTELLAPLRSPEYDRPKDHTSRFGPLKEIIWQAILQSPTPERVCDLAGPAGKGILRLLPPARRRRF